MEPNTGIAAGKLKEIAFGLARVEADTYLLYLKTHFFHWNITGSMFQPLHEVFETQYQELFLAVDQIAERIRALGFPAPGTTESFRKLGSIKEEENVPVWEEMVRQLAQGHETVARTIRKVLPPVHEGSDEASLDLLTDRLLAHEKTAWMLRSFVQEKVEEAPATVFKKVG